MSGDQKIKDRVKKLVNLAMSTSFEGERSTVAIKAVELMHEHKHLFFEDDTRIERPQKKRPVEKSQKTQSPAALWFEIQAPRAINCVLCEASISLGDWILTSGHSVLCWNCYH